MSPTHSLPIIKSEQPCLEDFIDTQRMRKLLQEMAKEFAAGMGLLGLRTDNSGNKELYPIIEKVNFSDFCSIVRTSQLGRIACQESDLQCALCKTPSRVCHAGLIDLAVPVNIKGVPVAFVYAGQIRHKNISVPTMEALKTLYDELGFEHSTSLTKIRSQPLSYNCFLHAFLSVARKTREEIKHLHDRLRQVADTISNLAQYSYYLRSIQRLGEHLVPIRDLREGIEPIESIVQDLFAPATNKRAFSYSIWRLEEDGEGKFLKPLAARWLSSSGQPISVPEKVRLDEGFECRSHLGHRHPIAQAMTSFPRVVMLTHAQVIGQRPPRYFSSIHSMLAVPILSENTPMGVLQLGHQDPSAFRDAEAKAAQALAGIVASLFRRHDEFAAFKQVATLTSRDLAARAAVEHATKLTLAERATVFFWERHSTELHLVPLNPDRIEAKADPSRKFYYEKEGLTGWVGFFGQPLNITDRKKLALQKYFKNTLRPKMLSEGWKDGEIEAPVWREHTRERTSTSRPSNRRPLLVVPIPDLSQRDHPRRPLGVIRVTDKAQGFFTQEDQRAVESLARLIAFCDQREKFRANFIEKAVYNFISPIDAIYARAERLSQSSGPDTVDGGLSNDFEEIKCLIQFFRLAFESMAYSYLGGKRGHGKSEYVDLLALVREVSSTYRIYAKTMYDKPVPDSFRLRSALEKDYFVNTNKWLLSVVVAHVLDNAFKACRSATKVEMRIRCRRDRVSISILDDGCGIPEDVLPRLFTMFEQNKFEQGEVARGLGIGLCASKDIVLLDLEGEIEVETRCKGGRQNSYFDVRSSTLVKKGIRDMRYGTGTVVNIMLPTGA
jgi:signal transduction histidine kinase/ligand-binding sensor protein